MSAVEAVGLPKRFGDTEALCGVDFEMPRATVLGVLGPNGAGKTTAVRILTTLLKPDAGRAVIDGIDVVADPRRRPGPHRAHRAVRRGRRAAHRLREPRARRPPVPPAGREARQRGPTSCSTRFDLEDAADRVGQGLLGRHAPPPRHRHEPHRPPVGAVPRRAHHRARPAEPARHVGAHRGARRATARRHCSPRSTSKRPTASPTRSSSIDHGTVIAAGHRRRAEAQVGGERVEVTLGDPRRPRAGRSRVLAPIACGDEPARRARRARVIVPVRATPTASCPTVVRALDAAGDRRARRRRARGPRSTTCSWQLTGHAAERGRRRRPATARREDAADDRPITTDGDRRRSTADARRPTTTTCRAAASGCCATAGPRRSATCGRCPATPRC